MANVSHLIHFTVTIETPPIMGTSELCSFALTRQILYVCLKCGLWRLQMLMSQELMNNRQRKGGAHILWPYMAGKSADEIRVWCKEQRESGANQSRKICAVCGYVSGWGWVWVGYQ